MGIYVPALWLVICLMGWLPVKAIDIPDPEELYEALIDGFIDYTDYIAFLEISRGGPGLKTDSLYLDRYPDLLAGLTANPHMIFSDDTSSTENGRSGSEPTRWRQAVLYRQYQKLIPGNDSKRVYRIGISRERLTVYGEFDQYYSGSRHFGRRYAEFDQFDSTGNGLHLTVGNYSDRIGLGLVYGYHGQLFSRTGSGDGQDGLPYPHYGGSNGIRLIRRMGIQAIKLLYDRDQSVEFGKDFGALSVPIKIFAQSTLLSAGFGHLRNRQTDDATEIWLLSSYFSGKSKVWRYQTELAVAGRAGDISKATAVDVTGKQGGGVTIRLTGWQYDRNYPTWFSGGPSSRRYMTRSLDNIDLNYSDRFAGETGMAGRTSLSLSPRWRLITAVAYAWRGDDDNRAEWRGGLVYRAGREYRVKFDCYWRADNLYSGQCSQRRMHVDFVHQRGSLRTRTFLGHRHDRHNQRNDFLIGCENTYDVHDFRIKLVFKLDRLIVDDPRNNHLYAAIAYETTVSKSMSSYIKYSRRYRRGLPGSSYGELRWDINWNTE
ncbi:MAG: hypothetical protein GY841_02065 [FCB group bacterium]|nr:hypothetical protein [FCB group bacterium]